MATLKNNDLILLERKPEDMPTVEIRGSGFAKNGYIVWHSGLSLSDLESAIGYNSGSSRDIVSVHRNGRRIYWMWKIKDKSDAPALAPGDMIVAQPPIDF